MSHRHRQSGMVRLMRIGSHLPVWFWRPVGNVVVSCLATRPRHHRRQWQLNYEVMTGHKPSWNTTRLAFTHWVENTMISLQLSHWSPAKVRARVILDNPEAWERLHDVLETGGLVAALPHMGSWDLIGAYACLDGLPVSSVAEALPDGQFEYFRKLRERLGFRIYSVRDRHGFAKLGTDLEAGRVICLVADRDFSRRGLPVAWKTAQGTRDQTMPPGPALLAQQSARPLVGVATWFDRRHKLHVQVTDLIEVGAGEQELIRATQQIADFFTAEISAHPLDWIMLQRFFKGVTI